MVAMNQENQTGLKQVTAKAHIPIILYLIWIYVAMPLAINPLLSAAGISFSTTIGAVFGNALTTLLPLIIYCLLARQHIKVVLPPVSLGLKNALCIVIVSAAGMLFVMFVRLGHFSTIIHGSTPTPQELPGLGAIWIPLLAFGLLTATFEELWFRGPIYSEYKKHGVSFWKIALLTGLLFGIIHSGIFQVSYTFVNGVIWAVMLYYTRSIWAPILAHVAGNSIFILLNPYLWASDYSALYDFLPTYVLIIGIAALVTIPIAVICMRKLILNNPREKEAPASETKLFAVGYWAVIAAMIALAVRFSI